MRSLIVGTAGHIDHGKSTLVKALTGTDPDRLKEEKERGITIDLGFAHADLGSGLVASFIDVPGHERFVRNMLAGAHGIDAVLLVVAADESVMPQTREHFAVCRLLGVSRGLVALTKCDLADPDLAALAEIEVRELVEGSFLDGAPLVRTSARTGQGLDEIRARLSELAARTPPRSEEGLLRLPVDRAFTLRGFGTVVTGTLVSGSVAVGEELELLPSGRRGRVRGLQVHGQTVERVGAGHRAAVNLSGLEVGQIARGDVVARPDTLMPTTRVDVELSLLTGERALRSGSRVRVHLASAEVLARVALLGTARMEPGTLSRARLRLAQPSVAGRGDRLVLRSYSPITTIGGAVVLDPLPPRRRPQGAAAPPAGADARAAAVAMIAEAGERGVAAGPLAARLTIVRADLPRLLEDEPAVVSLGAGSTYLSRDALARLRDAASAALRRFHREQPLRGFMPREELRTRVFRAAPDGAFEHVLAALEGAGTVRTGPEGIALAAHQVQLSGPEADARGVLVEKARLAGLEGVTVSGLAGPEFPAALLERASRVLLAEGTLRRVGDFLVEAGALDRLKDEVRRRWPPGSKLDVGAVKDMTGLSRKYVMPLLEYLDRERVTRRVGADRTVLA